MKHLAQDLKALLKSTLKRLSLYEFALKIRKCILLKWYRNTKRYAVTIDGVTVQFSTEDDYSKLWFFPRYSRGRIHEKAVTDMLVASLHSARCFMDVGTHLGWYTCMAAKHMPDGNVYGFEMDDFSYGLLKQNVAINELTNVEIFNVAVSDSSDVVSFKRDTKYPDTLHMETSKDDGKSAESVSVNSVKLDEFLESKGCVPDVIKIDVEGAEMKVLKGMTKTLIDHKPTMFVEVHPQNLAYFGTSMSYILSFLLRNGYNIAEIENHRNLGSDNQLRPLQKDSMLRENTMVYAYPAGK